MKKFLKYTIFLALVSLVLLVCIYGYYAFRFHKNLKAEDFNQIVSEAKIENESAQYFVVAYENSIPKSTVYGFWNSQIHKTECQSFNMARFIYPFVKKQNNNRLENLSFAYFLTLKIEKELSQEQCLSYLSRKFDFLYGNKGIEAASKFYFKKEVENLNPEELETLIQMCKNPVLYNPLRNN